MPAISAITGLALPLSTLYLIMVKQWEPLRAALTIGLIGLLIPLLLLRFVLPFVKPQDRPALWHAVLSTVRADVKQAVRWLRGKGGGAPSD